MSTPVNLPSESTVPIPQPGPMPTTTDVNALASQIKSMVDAASAGAVQLSQAKVVATNLAATPPTVSVTMSGSSVQIDGVTFMEGYTPTVNDNVDVLKQNNAILVLGHVADTGTSTQTSGGWAASGITGISYRKVLDNGAFKVQFMGSGTATSSTLFTLPAGFRPSVTRNMPVALSNNPFCWLSISTGGVVTLVAPFGGGTTGATDDGHTHLNTDDHTHSHGGAVAVTSFVDSTALASGVSHTHTIAGGTLTFSNTVWLDAKEFFL